MSLSEAGRKASGAAEQSTGLGLEHAHPALFMSGRNQTTCRLFITVVLFSSRRRYHSDKISGDSLFAARAYVLSFAVDTELNVNISVCYGVWVVNAQKVLLVWNACFWGHFGYSVTICHCNQLFYATSGNSSCKSRH